MDDGDNFDEIPSPEEHIEIASTLDTILLSDLQIFVNTAQSFLPSRDGIRLWVLINRLPEVTGILGKGCTMTRHGKTLVPPGGVLTSTPPYPLVPPEEMSVLTLVPPNPRVLKTGTKNRY